MRTDGIKLRIPLAFCLAALGAAGPALGQSAPLRFDSRLLPAGSILAAPSVADRIPRLRFDPRVGPSASMLGAAAAAAQEPAQRFLVRPVPAGAVLAGTIVLALVPSVYASRFPTATCAPCDPAGLWGIDRGTVGQVRWGAATASNGFLYASLGGSALFVIIEDSRGRGSALADLMVFSQAVATADAVTAWAKVLFHRPRPFRYVPAETTITTQSGLSFPSGHSTAAWASAFAYWSIQARRGRSHERTPQIALLLATAASTGVFRVLARQHFPTDVLAGAAIGATIGWFVPRLYPIKKPPSPM